MIYRGTCVDSAFTCFHPQIIMNKVINVILREAFKATMESLMCSMFELNVIELMN